MTRIVVQRLEQLPVAQRRIEHVERKGLGHPDTICDSIMEAASVALSQAYIDACGRVLHHNIDKGLLVAGQSTPRPGGGTVDKPMRLVFGDRATDRIGGQSIPVGDIVEQAAREWFGKHLRFVEPARHVVFQNEIQPGSAELVDIFARENLTANDTSAAVGYAPLTETEQLVLEAERYLNSDSVKHRFPVVGEDVKVMGYRLDRCLSLTVAAAFVDRFVRDAKHYGECKEAVARDISEHLQQRLVSLDRIEVALNTLDDPERGAGGMYLTVLGTSAEGADGGQVGRGNRVNGLISLHRPMSTEAAAGKNPVSHVGKIYNLLAQHMATQICERVAGVAEASVWLCSQIGRALADPWSAAVEIVPEADAHNAELDRAVQEVVSRELDNLPHFIEQLTRGERPVC